LLLDHGADFNVRNAKGQTPLEFADGSATDEIVNLLRAKSASVNTKGNNYATQQAANPPSSPITSAQQTALQNLMQNGLLMGTQDLKDNCDYTKTNLDRSVCNQKSILIPPLRELVAQNPNDYDANYFLGYLLVDLGKPAEAIGPLKIAAAQHPEYRWSYTVLAAAYDNLGDQGKAINLMEASLQRPKAHFASDHDENMAGFRYYDVYIWSDQVAKQYRYYVTSGQDEKANGLLAAYDPMFRPTILAEMRTMSALDMDISNGNIDAIAAVDNMKKGDKQRARDLFLNALELEPGDPDLLYGVASMSFDLRRYGDAAWAYQAAADKGEDLNSGSLVRMGVAYLVLGDYQDAYHAFDQAHAVAPLDSNIRRWRIAAAFGLGGWKMALDTLIATPPLDPTPRNFNEQRWMTYDIVYGVIKDADNRAQSVGLRYPRLGHLSLLHELLTEVVQWGFGNLDRNALEHERWNIAWQTVELYRALPLKPLPPKRALEQEMVAERAIREGKIGASKFESFPAAVAATTIAPWWPEAHYNLAIYARNSYFTRNLKYDGELYVSNKRIAAQEFLFYLSLAPKGANATAACRQLKDWGRQCPTN
jgi:tetratricopeptide (TPR) repeat protein